MTSLSLFFSSLSRSRYGCTGSNDSFVVAFLVELLVVPRQDVCLASRSSVKSKFVPIIEVSWVKSFRFLLYEKLSSIRTAGQLYK
jgi:hypothetical protein